MAPPPKQGRTFTPAQLKRLGDAFDLAVREASAAGTPYRSVPAPELRRQIAGLILAEAYDESSKPRRLAMRALDRLRTMVGGIDFIGRSWSERQVHPAGRGASARGPARHRGIAAD